jgi:hypothetical protein
MKQFILHSIFIFLVSTAWNQKAKVQLIVEPEIVGVNQLMNITIKSNVDGDVVENLPSNFIRHQGMHTQSSYVQDLNTGKMEQEHIVVFSGLFNKAGKYQIGPFYVKYGNKTYTSNTVKVEVLANSVQSSPDAISNRELRQPAFGIIELSSQKVYEGEPVVISGRVYSKKYTAGRPILRQPFEVQGVVDFFPLQQVENWETRKVKGNNYESFGFEKKVFFPVGTNPINVQPFEVYLPFNTIQGYNVVSSSPTIEVMPLPTNAPKEFIGGVGNFTVSFSQDKKQIKQGDIVQVKVEVEGKGNLHAIETPNLKLASGMSTYGDVEVKEDFIVNSSGCVGKMIYTYHVQVTKEGKQQIKPLKIAYFDPKEEIYKFSEAAQALVFEVKANPQFEMDAEQNDHNQTEYIATSKDQPQAEKKQMTTYFWLGVGGVTLAAAALLLLFVRSKRRDEEVVTETVQKKEASVQVNIPVHSINAYFEFKNQASFYGKEGVADKFYASLEKAVVALMHYELAIPSNETLLRNDLVHRFSERFGNKATAVNDLLNACDAARYGMQGNTTEMELLLTKLEQIES